MHLLYSSDSVAIEGTLLSAILQKFVNIQWAHGISENIFTTMSKRQDRQLGRRQLDPQNVKYL